jgi:hypothetical protein
MLYIVHSVASFDRLDQVSYTYLHVATVILYRACVYNGRWLSVFILSSVDLSNWCFSVLLIILCLVFGLPMFRFVHVLRICMLTLISVGDYYFCHSYSPCQLSLSNYLTSGNIVIGYILTTRVPYWQMYGRFVPHSPSIRPWVSNNFLPN